MKTINYSTARQNLREVLDECVNDSVPIVIKSLTSEVVLISKAEYDRMQNIIKGVR